MKLRPRFSLLTLLSSIVIFALALAVWTLSQEVLPLRNEVETLRESVQSLKNEAGLLTDFDKSRLQVIRIRSYRQNEWKWRVNAPEKTNYIASCEWRLPWAEKTSELQLNLPSGEFVLTFVMRPNYDNKWETLLFVEVGPEMSLMEFPNGVAVYTIDGRDIDQNPYMQNPPKWESYSRFMEASEPLKLLEFGVSNSSLESDARGSMVVIIEEED